MSAKACTCILSSSIGRKFFVAASGLILTGFVVGHMLGNLQVFLGQDKFNTYAAFLQGLGELLYIIRAFLLLTLLTHIYFSIRLTLENRAARPVPYAMKTYREASYASRTMHYSGMILFAFIIYHLLHLTLGKVHPQYYDFIDGKGRHDVYTRVILSFQHPAVAIAYIISMFLLAWHLSHGFASLFQTLGLSNPRYQRFLRGFGALLAWGIFAGYVSIPIAAWTGILKLPAGVTP